MHPLDIRQLCEDCNLSDPLSERSSFFETSSFLSKSTRYLRECRVKKVSANFVGELMQIFNSSAHALFDIFHDCFFQPPSFQPPVQFIYSFGYKVISIISCLWDIKIIEAKSEVNTKPQPPRTLLFDANFVTRKRASGLLSRNKKDKEER